MKKLVMVLPLGVALLCGLRVASAEVNCEQVRRYLKTGRSAEDIAETMVVDVQDVKKCQETSGSSAAPPTPAPKERR